MLNTCLVDPNNTSRLKWHIILLGTMRELSRRCPGLYWTLRDSGFSVCAQSRARARGWRNLGTHYRVSKYTYTHTHANVYVHKEKRHDELGVCLSNITFVSRSGRGLNNRGNVSTNATRALRFYKSKIFIFDSPPWNIEGGKHTARFLRTAELHNSADTNGRGEKQSETANYIRTTH